MYILNFSAALWHVKEYKIDNVFYSNSHKIFCQFW